MNDFELPVFMRYRELSEIRDELLKAGAFRAALSGSGSVVFGQFRTKQEAFLAASSLSPRYSVKVANPLGRAEYFLRMIET
jgi:4-diphosphocytidyl-2-C-methyl-D-erythritol kinase